MLNCVEFILFVLIRRLRVKVTKREPALLERER